MTIEEASEICGLAPYTLRQKARSNNPPFAATKPSNREGWDINENSFRGWLKRRRINSANAAMKGQLLRGSVQ